MAQAADFAARVRTAFPALAFSEAVLAQKGEDHHVVMLDGRYVFRFPRHADHPTGLALERAVLAALKGRCEVAVPDYRYVAPDGAFAGYKMIAGDELTPTRFARLSRQTQERVLDQIADFVSAMHGLTVCEIEAAAGATFDWPREGSPADYAAEVIAAEIITSYFADRNLEFDVSSPQATLTNGGFNCDLMTITYLTNSVPAPGTDYNITIPLEPSHDTNGTFALTGSATNDPNTAYLTNTEGKLTFFFPVSFTNVLTKSGYTVTNILKGTVVATAPASAWPLPLSVGLQDGQVSLTWPSFPGPTFTVQSTGGLGSSWNTASGVTTVHANTSTWTGSATNTAQFYRLHATF